MSNELTKIAVFKGKKVRKTIHNNEWWFVIEDVVAALTDSVQPSGYIKDMRRRDPELSKGWGQIATPLAVETAGGLQKINCANTEGIFRLIQSIPFEQKTGESVVSGGNYLRKPQDKKLRKGS